MNFWYVSKPNEIFVDTDNYSRSIKHTAARLLGAIESGRLKVKDIEYHESKSQDHLHSIIVLEDEMPAIERYVWGLILHSDIYRAASNIMREIHCVQSPDVFITPQRFRVRNPDDACDCEGKHKAETMMNCEAAIRLRGPDRVRGFFGKPNNSAQNLQDVALYLAIKGRL